MGIRISPQQKLDTISRMDKTYWTQGKTIIGMDEAGRGPLAGPVVAAAVIMPSEDLIVGVDDSKKLSEKMRQKLYAIIKEKAVDIGVGIVDHEVIDEVNILNASRMAFKQAFNELKVSGDVVLSDYITGLDIGQYTAIKKGDSKCYSIACASIVAKVVRDEIMREFDNTITGYEFSSHKGYGTKKHYAALKQHGISKIHRRSFLKNFVD